MNKQELCQRAEQVLSAKYNSEIIDNLVSYILKSDYFKNEISKKNVDLELSLDSIFVDLLRGRPVQYCIGEAYFMDLVLFVDERVLIPRVETEELCAWCIDDLKGKKDFKVIDIGTGSGAISIQLAKNFQSAQITAIDISKEALKVAEMNRSKYQVKIDFQQLDFLKANFEEMKKFDIIISNPPYISFTEQNVMRKEVLAFEPHIALFADELDPDIFYRRIANFGNQNLNQGGCIYLELNEFRSNEIIEIFKTSGYKNIELRKDLQGKDRMLKVKRDH